MDIFIKFKDRLTNQIRKTKATYYKNEFIKNSQNLKKTWSLINNVLKPKKSNQAINIIDDNGIKIQQQDVPTKFVDYFTNIAEHLTNQLPDSPLNPDDFLRNRNQNTFVFIPANDKDIEDVITNLKDNGIGVHKIPNSILKHVVKEISPILAQITNICTHQGYFPHELKIGCITPIFKNGNKTTISNYRPVCSLSPIRKIIEKGI